jgi:glycylpeptide N-tetradecanoyltransferase
VLCVPGYNKEWHVGVRSKENGKFLAFITGTPCKVSVRNQVMKMAEINFLCIHRKLRSKRLAPLLIKEITRRVNLTNVWQAIYTSGSVFPKPFSCASYYHRNLNPVKNVKTGFSYKAENMSLAAYKKQYKLPEFPAAQLVGTPRPMEKRDAAAVFALYKAQQAKFDVFFKYTQPELLS